jgi:hypothetical protein
MGCFADPDPHGRQSGSLGGQESGNHFHSSFPAGLAVLKPFPQHTTALVEPALRLAKGVPMVNKKVVFL